MGRGGGVGWEGDGHEGGFHTLVGNSQTAPDAPVFLRGKLIPVLRGDPGSKRGERGRDLPSPHARSGAHPGRPAHRTSFAPLASSRLVFLVQPPSQGRAGGSDDVAG